MRVNTGRVGKKYALLAGGSLLLLGCLTWGRTAAAPKPTPNAAYSSYFNSSAKNDSKNKKSSGPTKKAENSSIKTLNATNSVLLDCKFGTMHPGISSSSNSILRKVAEYEKICGGGVASRVMVFTNMPASQAEAASKAADFATTLKEFARFNVPPLVIMEPTTSTGSVNFHNYSKGAYDSILSTYFQTLKAHGISDDSMGMWVYFPEANIPTWGPTDPVDFANNVTRTVKVQKKYFPKSQSSIMLDAMSYPAGSAGWDNGAYVSLAPYVKSIPKGLLDSFGLQGFPWVPAANIKSASNLNPAVFLNSNIGAEAARTVGVSSIWLNSGSFRASYTTNSAQTVVMSTGQRQTILDGIAEQAINLRRVGFKVAINLFSQDKSRTDEAIDWSYWRNGQEDASPLKPILKDFIGKLHASGVDFWLFDTL